MSAPLPLAYLATMRRHVAALRRAGYTWAEVAACAGHAAETCRRMVPEDRRRVPLFGTVTRVHANGKAHVVRGVA